MGYGDYYLAKTENFVYDLFKIFDEWDTWKTAEELSKFEDLIDSFIIIQSRKDTKKSIMLLKSVISSVETNDDNKGETQGLSSHDDRRDNHVSLVFKHHFRNFTKKFALKLLADLIVNYPDNLPVEELINLGCHLASSEAEALKIYGLKLIRKIYKVSGHVKDTEDPKKLMIELYEAQVSAIIRESLDCRNISVEMHANKLFLKFLMTPGTQEISVVNKLINPIIGSLSLNPKSNIYLVIILDGYSDNFCSKLYLSRLITLAKLLLYSPLFIQSILIE